MADANSVSPMLGTLGANGFEMVRNLLSNAAATGTAQVWQGGAGVFRVAGTFSGATVKLQYLGPDGVTWIDAGSDTTLTAAGGGVFNLDKCSVRAAVTGGPPSGMYATIDKLGA